MSSECSSIVALAKRGALIEYINRVNHRTHHSLSANYELKMIEAARMSRGSSEQSASQKMRMHFLVAVAQVYVSN